MQNALKMFQYRDVLVLSLGLILATFFHWSLFPASVMVLGCMTFKREQLHGILQTAVGITFLLIALGFHFGKQAAERDNLSCESCPSSAQQH